MIHTVFGLSATLSDQDVTHNNVFIILADDDDFNWNYGLSQAASGDYMAAEETLLKVQNPSYKSDVNYCAWLARCQIKNDRADSAWNIFPTIGESDRIFFLKVVAEDCFTAQRFLVAARAFDHLQRLDKDVDYFSGLKSACIGVFRSIMLEKFVTDEIKNKSKDELKEAIDILQGHLEVDDLKKVLVTFKHWMKKNMP